MALILRLLRRGDRANPPPLSNQTAAQAQFATLAAMAKVTGFMQLSLGGAPIVHWGASPVTRLLLTVWKDDRYHGISRR